MIQVMAIAAGGALGAVLRYWASTAVYTWAGRGFPWGTLAVNVLGSLMMGLLSVWLLERMTQSAEWRAFLLIGLLGAFTTFSAFSIETLSLIEQGQHVKALVNALSSVLLCVAAAWIGVVLARQL
jgi:CrcB protein